MSLPRLILSFGGFGLFPVIPGTTGTVGAALAAGATLWLWPEAADSWWLVCGGWIVGASLLTVWLTPLVSKEAGIEDPGVIVMDEVAGYWATLLGVTEPRAEHLVVAFFVFRFLDIVKPWPACALERLHGGWGVLLDDVAAGLYGAGAIALVTWLAA